VSVTDAPAADDVVAATWELGVAALRSGDGPNVVVSPSSLVTALAMLGEGAVGDEAAPFDAALGAKGSTRTDAVNYLTTALSRYDGDPAVVQADTLPTTPMLHTAGRVVLDDDPQHAPAQAFLDRLQHGYGAGVLVTDLASDKGTKALSAWVDENTGGLVKKTAITPSPALVAVLQDAMVLAAAWQYPFNPYATYDASFAAAAPGNKAQPDLVPVLVPTMHAELSVAVVESDGWQAVRLGYTDDLSADLLLPPAQCVPPADGGEECTSPPDVYTNPGLVDPQVLANLSTALDTAQPTEVSLAVPTLDLVTTTDLVTVLTDLGIVGQGLTGVRADGKAVVVTQAVQQAVLQVDEDGTRAAAVTEIAMGEGALPPQEILEISFDRPFLFIIRDGTTGWPVLLASITDPR